MTSEALHIALHIVIFESFIKSTVSYLPKLKVTPSFCFVFEIPDDLNATNMPIKYDAFFSAASFEKDIIRCRHLKQIFGPSYFVRALLD